MKIISLSYEDAGYACSIGTSIKKKYNQQTNFFDFLVVDMRTINHILTLKDLTTPSSTDFDLHNDYMVFKSKNKLFHAFSLDPCAS